MRWSRLDAVFDPATRTLVAALWAVGVALSVWTIPSAIDHPAAGPWEFLLIPIIGLGGLTIATLRGVRWAFAVDLVLLGAQIPGGLAVLWELAHFSESSKAAEVAALGFDPLLGLLINLAFSSVCGAVFVWLAVRLR